MIYYPLCQLSQIGTKRKSFLLYFLLSAAEKTMKMKKLLLITNLHSSRGDDWMKLSECFYTPRRGLHWLTLLRILSQAVSGENSKQNDAPLNGLVFAIVSYALSLKRSPINPLTRLETTVDTLFSSESCLLAPRWYELIFNTRFGWKCKQSSIKMFGLRVETKKII